MPLHAECVHTSHGEALHTETLCTFRTAMLVCEGHKGGIRKKKREKDECKYLRKASSQSFFLLEGGKRLRGSTGLVGKSEFYL